jgi:hypothetical protein
VEPWFVPAALWIDGEPAWVETEVARGVEDPVEVRRIPLTTDLQLRTVRETRAVLYFDGSAWLTLGEFDPAGLDVRVTPRPRFGALSGPGRAHERRGGRPGRACWRDRANRWSWPSWPAPEVPRRAVDGVAEARATAMHVTAGVPLDLGAFRPAPRDVPFEVVARGQQAVGVTGPLVPPAAHPGRAGDRLEPGARGRLQPPPLPGADLERETLLAVFLGPKPTGGYGADVRGVTLEGGDLFVDLVRSRPGPARSRRRP